MKNREALAETSACPGGANAGGVGPKREEQRQEQKFPRLHRVWTRISEPQNFEDIHGRGEGIYR